MENVIIAYGDHELTFDPDEHKYWLESDPLISVTQYLKLAGYCRPYNGDGSAALLGRRVHTATQYADHGLLDRARLYPGYLRRVNAWDKFKRERKFVPDLNWRERPSYHPIYRYGATPDAPGLLDGEPTIVEIKSGEFEKWHELQVAGGYAPVVAQHDKKYVGAKSLLVYLQDDEDFRAIPVKKGQQAMLFASITATVNGRTIYGNNN